MPETGVVDGRLRPCPDSPNCVSSFAPPGDAEHHIPAIPYDDVDLDLDALLDHIVAAADAIPRSRLVGREGPYLHFEFRSRVFRFVDDVEFLIDEDARTIHLRSASRIGYSDLGVNRDRMVDLSERIRARLAAAG